MCLLQPSLLQLSLLQPSLLQPSFIVFDNIVQMKREFYRQIECFAVFFGLRISKTFFSGQKGKWEKQFS
jgi:hypothetical protein